MDVYTELWTPYFSDVHARIFYPIHAVMDGSCCYDTGRIWSGINTNSKYPCSTICPSETFQAIRIALQSGLKVLFLMGSTALFIALLSIITIPVVPIESEE